MHPGLPWAEKTLGIKLISAEEWTSPYPVRKRKRGLFYDKILLSKLCERKDRLPLSKKVGSPKEEIHLWRQVATIFECQASPIKTYVLKDK